MAGMRRGEHKVINGFFVRKSSNLKIRNRDGSPKACYCIFTTEEDMNDDKNMITYLWTMADVKESTKYLSKA